jgi:glycerol-3-phosphate dehydrogenase
VEEAIRRNGPELGEEAIQHLVLNYGSEYARVLGYLDLGPEMKESVGAHSPVMKAEIVHALREEMTERLSDVVLRRTELGILGYPGDDALAACGEIMARERGWTEARTKREIGEVRSKLSVNGEIPAAISKRVASG